MNFIRRAMNFIGCAMNFIGCAMNLSGLESKVGGSEIKFWLKPPNYVASSPKMFTTEIPDFWQAPYIENTMRATSVSHQDRDSGLERASGRGVSAQQPAWLPLLQRADREVLGANRVIRRCMVALFNVSEGEQRTVALVRVSRGLRVVKARLDRAGRRIDRALKLAALDPRDATAASPHIFKTHARWFFTAEILEKLLVPETQAAIDRVRAARGGHCGASADAFDFPSIELPELELLRAFLRPDGSAECERLRLLRRRRSTPLRSTDAPRRISRGRAPPSDSICQL